MTHRDEYTISTDKAHLDIDVIHGFLKECYWAIGIPRSIVEKSILHTALCFGMYRKDPSLGAAELIGFARVVSDLSTFAYLADVFVIPADRGLGLGKWLIETVMAHPDLQGLRRFMLGTADAHGLYAQFGFKPLANPDRMMEINHGMSVYKR